MKAREEGGLSEKMPGGRTCSFCGKHQDDVRLLIASDGANICDGCVITCLDVLLHQSRRAATQFRLSREKMVEIAADADAALLDSETRKREDH